MECYGCQDRLGYRVRHQTVFTDSRTGRQFCHECIAGLVTWELDGCPEPDQYSFPEWIDDELTLKVGS